MRAIFQLFPAHAGMNRSLTLIVSPAVSVPRARGDEPKGWDNDACWYPLFPAHAGMNRDRTLNGRFRGPVPRARGDEPQRHHFVL